MAVDLAAAAEHVPSWLPALIAMVAPGIAWFAAHRLQSRQMRLQERTQDVSGETAIAATATQLMTQARTQLDWSQQELERYRTEIEQLRRYRYGIEERMVELYEAAIAARTMVHELQRRLGDPDTLFLPLSLPGSAASIAPRP